MKIKKPRMMTNRAAEPCLEWKKLVELGEDFNDASYANQQSKISIQKITKRLVQIGFHSKNTALDLGCGYGQWTKVLSVLNDSALGIDLNINRISIANQLFEDSIREDKLIFKVGNASETKLPDESFDYIFCYGVFMFLKPEKTLIEIYRLLKPGGKIYLVTNSDGWWLYLFLKSLFKSFAMSKAALTALSLRSKRLPTSLTKRKLKRMFMNSGFKVIWCGSEGSFNMDHSDLSFYRRHFLAFPVTLEIIAEK